MTNRSPYPPWRVIVEPDYEIWILEGVDPLCPEDDNVDVYVRFPDGAKFGATFFTLQNVDTLMSTWSRTGECSGLYFWCTDPIIVRRLTIETIREVVQDLYRTGDLRKAFKDYGRWDETERETS